MAYSGVKKEMVGRRFSDLLVLSEVTERDKNSHIVYLCVCLCGKKKEILGASIRSGATKSCGCGQRRAATKHGKDGTATYRAWISMKSRCNNPRSRNYGNYGGRGISICDRWKSFGNFIADMGEVKKGLSIDRIDNNKGYTPSNCRWATAKEQSRNRRVTIKVRHNGKDMYMDDFAKEVGLSESGARKRVKRAYIKGVDGIFVKETDGKMGSTGR